MKYRADQLSNGQYAVFTGRKYFTDTVTDSKEQAEKFAMVESMVWHRNQMDKIISKAEDSGYFEGENVHDYLA